LSAVDPAVGDVLTAVDVPVVASLIKNKIKFSSYVRKFRVEQMQSHI
jgi:hypothetical protein